MTDPGLLNLLPRLLLAVSLLVGLLLLRRILRLLRLEPDQQARLDRWRPTVELLAGGLYAVWAFMLVLPPEPRTRWVVAIALLFLLVVGAWFAVQDVVAGVVLRSERALRIGLALHTPEAEGRLTKIGYRGLEVETDHGLRVQIPYRRLVKNPLALDDERETASAHTFQVALPATQPVPVLREHLRVAALNTFWASVQRPPQVDYETHRDEAHHFEVTVYGLDDAYGPLIEAHVRAAVLPTADPSAG
ncbi:MAG: mechanosensitive ion channel domain-containing protein [Bacteroidota bacterium]